VRFVHPVHKTEIENEKYNMKKHWYMSMKQNINTEQLYLFINIAIT
jgi:hypothetical protein